MPSSVMLLLLFFLKFSLFPIEQFGVSLILVFFRVLWAWFYIIFDFAKT
jgi:hypothetical protein